MQRLWHFTTVAEKKSSGNQKMQIEWYFSLSCFPQTYRHSPKNALLFVASFLNFQSQDVQAVLPPASIQQHSCSYRACSSEPWRTDFWLTCIAKNLLFQKITQFNRIIFKYPRSGNALGDNMFSNVLWPSLLVLPSCDGTLMLAIFWEVLSLQGEKETFTLTWQWPRVLFEAVPLGSFSTITFSYPAESSPISHAYSPVLKLHLNWKPLKVVIFPCVFRGLRITVVQMQMHLKYCHHRSLRISRRNLSPGIPHCLFV